MATAGRWSLCLARSNVLPRVTSRPNIRAAISTTPQRYHRRQQHPPLPRRPAAQRRDDPPPEDASKQSQPHSPPPTSASAASAPSPGPNTQLSTTLASTPSPDLLAPVHIPSDPHTVLPAAHPALALLANSSLIIQRQLEMMNVLLGFEQANRYVILSPTGEHVGYVAEQDHGLGSTMKRQMFKTHRSFTTHIFDARGREVLRVHRPFAWVNSRIRIYDAVPEGGYSEDGQGSESGMEMTETKDTALTALGEGAAGRLSPLKLEDMRVIGEAQQQWAPLRRKYNLFAYRPLDPSDNDPVTEADIGDGEIEKGMRQFAAVDEPFLSYAFHLRDEDANLIGSVNRDFSGFARELFTDTGVYALRMASAAQQQQQQQQQQAAQSSDASESTSTTKPDTQLEPAGTTPPTALPLDHRAILLATAISIDFDYFSRHSSHHSRGLMPFYMPMGGGGGAAGEAGAVGAAGAAGAAGEVGALEGAAAGAAGTVGRGAVGGAAESGIAGAGTMAGYEAMQRGVYGSDGNSPQGPQNEDLDPQASSSSAPDVQGQDNPYAGQGRQGQGEHGSGGDVWGEGADPWAGGESGGAGGGGGGGGGGGDGGGWMDAISEFFGS